MSFYWQTGRSCNCERVIDCFFDSKKDYFKEMKNLVDKHDGEVFKTWVSVQIVLVLALNTM
jgi:predicted transcriptional regulator